MVTDAKAVRDISILSEGDRKQIFSWNVPHFSPVQECLHHLVDRSVARNPDSTAIESWDGTLTYRELSHLSSKLANHLIVRYNIGPGTSIPLCFEKSLWAIVAMLAILKCGASYACIDPSYPSERRKHIIDTLGANLMITSPLQQGNRENCLSIVVHNELLTTLTLPNQFPKIDVGPSSGCLVVFTSGSTGKPKGFVHEHVSICTGLLSNAPRLELDTCNARVLQWAAYTFDISIPEIWTPLIHGGRVCVPSEEERLQNVEECMIRMEVNWVFFTPSFARFFQRYWVPSLKVFVFGGEALNLDDVQPWVDKVRVLNAYSPAEVMNWFVEPQTGESDVIAIGRLTPNMLGWIVDPENHNHLLPVGAVGELLMEGPGLLRGYLRNPEKTEEVLIQEPPPWRTKISGPSYKMYKTGDLVKYLEDGRMVHLGRKDTMVKIRGQRMELSEVEISMRRHLPQSVQSAADVIQPADGAQEPILVAFLHMTGREQRMSIADMSAMLQTELAKSLPEFMVPRVYIPVSEMPYNTSQKLDRTKLREHASSLTLNQLMGMRAAPNVEKEENNLTTTKASILCAIWAESLQITPSSINVQDNFFALGGTSVAALKVIATAKVQGLRISYQDLFRLPSLGALVDAVDFVLEEPGDVPRQFALVKDARGANAVIVDAASQCAINKEKIGDIYPLTPQQEGLWALSLVQRGSYVAQFIITLKPETDVTRLCAAWDCVIKMLPIFRSRFIHSPTGFLQVVIMDDMKWYSDSSLLDYLRKDRQLPMALGDPLNRYAVVSEGSEQNPGIERTADAQNIIHRIVWTAHHALFDGQSTPQFLNTVAQVYNGNVPNARIIAPFNTFIDHVQKLDESICERYWKSLFDLITPAHFPCLPSPTYHPKPQSEYERYIYFTRRLSSRITTPTLLQAAWALTLAEVTGSHTPAFGITLAGRTAPVAHIETLIGPTFITLPQVNKIDLEDSVRGLLEKTQSSNVSMIPYEHTGMQKIMGLSPQCFAACQFQNLLMIQTQDDTSYEEVFDFFDMTGGLGRFNSYALMWICYLNDDGIRLAASFDDRVIGRERLESLTYQFERMIHILCLEEDNRFLTSMARRSPVNPGTSNDLRLKEDLEKEKVIANGVKGPPTIEEDIDNARRHSEDSKQRPVEYMLQQKVLLGVSSILGIKLEDLDLESSFIAQGGNSISAIRLTATLKADNISLAVHHIMEPRRLSSLVLHASILDKSYTKQGALASTSPEKSAGSPDRIPEGLLRQLAHLTGSDNTDQAFVSIRPCTPTQKQILHSQARNPNCYRTYTIFKVTEATVSPSAIDGAWKLLVNRHEILRTIFLPQTAGTEEVQIILRNLEPLVQHTSSGADDPSEALGSITIPESTSLQPRHFCSICVADNGRLAFRVDIDHILSDGPSHLLMVRELNACLRGEELPNPSQIGPYVEQRSAADIQQSLSYWKDYVMTMKPCQIKGTGPSSQLSGFSTISMNLEISSNLSELCRRLQITPATLFRLIWALVLGEITHSNEVAFGYLVSSRDIEYDNMDRIMGPLFHVLPCKFSIKQGVKFQSLLRDMHQDSIDGLAHQMVSLPEVCMSLGKDISGRDFFSTLVNHRLFASPFEGEAARDRCVEDLGTVDPMDVS